MSSSGNESNEVTRQAMAAMRFAALIRQDPSSVDPVVAGDQAIRAASACWNNAPNLQGGQGLYLISGFLKVLLNHALNGASQHPNAAQWRREITMLNQIPYNPDWGPPPSFR